MYKKNKTYRSAKYLKFIRSKPCLVCGSKSVPHHESEGFYNSGMGMKPPDTQCLPLCIEHHAERHRIPAQEFYDNYNIDFKVKMVNLLTEFIQKG